MYPKYIVILKHPSLGRAKPLVNNIIHCPVFDNFMLSSDIKNRQTRHTGIFHLPYCRLKILSTSIYLIGPKLWNILPEDIRCASSVHIFKILVKKFICEHNLQSFLWKTEHCVYIWFCVCMWFLFLFVKGGYTTSIAY